VIAAFAMGGAGLGLRDLCDVVYVLRVEQLERVTLALVSGLASTAIEGAWDLPGIVRADFDASLNADDSDDPVTENQIILRQLGVA
jgi:hypothetical protein